MPITQSGPTIECELGDRIIIEVINHLEDPITIHWHGQTQRASNIMDGVSGVTQVKMSSLSFSFFFFFFFLKLAIH